MSAHGDYRGWLFTQEAEGRKCYRDISRFCVSYKCMSWEWGKAVQAEGAHDDKRAVPAPGRCAAIWARRETP